MVNVIGLCYIGLPTALMLAKSGMQVVGTDINPAVVGSLTADVLTFQEEGLEALFSEALASGIRFTTEYQKTDFYITTVPTQYVNCSKGLDPTHVLLAVNTVLDICEREASIVIESTVSPGSIDRHVRPLIEYRGLRAGVDVQLAHAPERIMPGQRIQELVINARTVVVDHPWVGDRVRALDATFVRSEIFVTYIHSHRRNVQSCRKYISRY